MVKAALEKLSENQLAYCKTISALIYRTYGVETRVENAKYRGKLRGYLECMRDMDLISKSEYMSLYLWFSEEDRGA